MSKLNAQWVAHFDSGGRMYSKYKRLMSFVEKFGRVRTVWTDDSKWSGESVTTLWTAIWVDFDPYMRTKTMSRTKK